MQFEVDRGDLRRTRVTDREARPLPAGAARLRIESFALTSNNVTYAAFGEALGYWNFFPAAEGSDGTHWGCIPVWGFAEVVESDVADVAVGRRVYGFWPMATELVVEPGRCDARGFHDLAAHRRPMASAYNRYLFVDADPVHEADREAQHMVLWPLFFTSFLIDDFFGDAGWSGATTVIVSSASSKTAIAAAWLLAARDGVRVVGLTSERNREFVASLGCYDVAASYDEVATLAEADAVFIDVAGNADVRGAVHARFGERLRSSLIVGGTHWDHEAVSVAPHVGPRPEFFFAPAQSVKRAQDWGQERLDERVGAAWRRFTRWTDGWLRFEPTSGFAAVERAYLDLLDGRLDPRTASICALTRAPRDAAASERR